MRDSTHRTPLARALAERVVALAFDDIPSVVLHWAKIGILDTVGVTLAGHAGRDEATRLLVAALAPAQGASLLFGSRRRVGALDAALINGTAGHALDFDDCNNTICGHPSVPVLPALFALADETPCSGRAFVTAYVAGVETECKIARGAGLHQYMQGWHPTATLGVFGAAAACAHLLRLDAAATARALAIATSLASGHKGNFGTMTKPLHTGHCARSGLLAARLAQQGFTANEDAFEHPQGYLALFNGEGHFDDDAMLAAWGAPYDLAEPALAIKQYPCCGSTHPAIDAMLDVVRTHRLRPADVRHVEAWIHRRRLQHTNRPDPQSALDAKFSLQYCLARALNDGAVRLEHFEGNAYEDSAVRALLPRIHVAPYTDDQFDPANHFAGAVRVTTNDGRVFEGRVEEALGRSATRPVPAPLLADKFRLCAARAVRPDTIDQLSATLARIDTLDDVRAFTSLLETCTL